MIVSCRALPDDILTPERKTVGHRQVWHQKDVSLGYKVLPGGKKKKTMFHPKFKKIFYYTTTPCVVRHRMNLSFSAYHPPEPARVTKHYTTSFFALNKMNPELNISTGYFMVVCLLL